MSSIDLPRVGDLASERRPAGALILLVADLFHPLDSLTVEGLLDRDVGHRRGGRRPVPMLLTRREPDHVAGPDLLDRPTPALRPAAAGRHDQRLTERVGVPGGPG